MTCYCNTNKKAIDKTVTVGSHYQITEQRDSFNIHKNKKKRENFNIYRLAYKNS